MRLAREWCAPPAAADNGGGGGGDRGDGGNSRGVGGGDDAALWAGVADAGWSLFAGGLGHADYKALKEGEWQGFGSSGPSSVQSSHSDDDGGGGDAD